MATDTGKVGHTPTPWRIDGSQISGAKHCRYIVGGEDGEHPTIFVESLCQLAKDIKQFEANADFIVRAVNAHDDMKAALKHAAACLRLADRSSAWREERDKCVAQIEAALSRAEQVRG